VFCLISALFFETNIKVEKNTLQITSAASKIIFDVTLREQLARTNTPVCRIFEDFYSDEYRVFAFRFMIICSLADFNNYTHFLG
jgi:hypothetical protein